MYSLGVVGYFAASGRLPFPGATAAEILEQHINRPAPPLLSRGRVGWLGPPAPLPQRRKSLHNRVLWTPGIERLIPVPCRVAAPELY